MRGTMTFKQKAILGQSIALSVAVLVGGCKLMGQGSKPATMPSTNPSATGPATQPAPVAKVRKAVGIAGVYNVRDFGAVGNGKTIDSPAINAAIEAASAAGGGTVRLPAGVYLSYSIRLKNNITLDLNQGAVLKAANIRLHGGEGYDAPEEIGEAARYQDYGHSHWRNSLIWGEGLDNIAITGLGTIDGGLYAPDGGPAPEGAGRGRGVEAISVNGLSDGLGGNFGGGGARGARGRGPASQATTNSTDGAARGPATAGARGRAGGGGGRGPAGPFTSTPAADLSVPFRETGQAFGVGNKAISLKLCKNVTLSDFTIHRGGWFALLATGVDNLTIDNLKVDTNRDGFDIDGCRNVRISNCAINSPHDDAIVLKSSWGLGYAQACENVTITNCLVAGGWEVGSMLNAKYTLRNPGTGRIKFGTESNGGFKNITISNCVFDRCQGLALEAVDGAIIDNVSISNITMREIISLPIFIRLGDRRRMPIASASVGAIRHVNISDIVAQNLAGQYACIISGIPGHPIEDVRISNVRIIWPGGGTAEMAAREVPELEYAYPEPSMFGAMPSYGFFIRHVDGIDLSNISMTYLGKDVRPPFQLQNVKNAQFNHIDAPREQDVPMFILKAVENFSTHEVKGVEDTKKDAVQDGKY